MTIDTTKQTLPASSLNPAVLQARELNLHEYSSKALMDKYGVRTQKWRLATTPEEAESAAKDLNAVEFVVKAQILAGGRGKGVFDNGFKGGVHLCKTYVVCKLSRVLNFDSKDPTRPAVSQRRCWDTTLSQNRHLLEEVPSTKYQLFHNNCNIDLPFS